MKVRNRNARSYVATAARGLTVLAVSATLTLGGIAMAPASATAATSSPQALANSRAMSVRAAKAKAVARANARAMAVRAAKAKAQARANARAMAVRAAKAKAIALANARAMAARAAKRLHATSAAAGGWYRATVSWYGPGFYGHGMAGGGVLQVNSMVVAHKTLRFGTRVEFAYGGRTVIAVVKDRGPFVAGRMFDLGPGTARAIGFDKVGVGQVQYRILP